MTLLILFVSLALGVSFLCSLMEAVLLSATPSYLAMREERGDRAAGQMRAFKVDVDRPLAAILSLNTIAHTVGATGAGAQAVAVFGDAWVGLSSAVLTLLILVGSEIIPKTLGALYWRSLLPTIASLLRLTMVLMWPLVQVSNVLTRWLARGRTVTKVSRDEISALADIGTRHGTLAEGETRILKSLLRFRDLRVRDVMTPRTVVFTLPRGRTVGEVLDEHDELRFSRIPVTGQGHDDITEYVLKDEILLRGAGGEVDLPVSRLARPLLIVPEVLSLPVVLDRLLERREHIAVVAGEFGGYEGIVTLEDVIETLLGLEIVDEGDRVTDMQKLARERWRARARSLGIPIDE